MIIDAFTFFNELDLLEARLEYLYDTVDYFVIVESNVSHSGRKKPFHYLDNKDNFKKFQDKIIWSPFIFVQEDHNVNFDSVIDKTDSNSPYWYLEKTQRSQISVAVQDFSEDDLIIISDLDEFPNKDAINFVKNNIIPDVECATLTQKLFYYNTANISTDPWDGSVIATVRQVKKHGAQWFRDHRWNSSIIPHVNNGGWHFSYFGGVDKIITKIENTAHQELNINELKDRDNIKKSISQGTDLFGRGGVVFTKTDDSHLPKDLLNCMQRVIQLNQSGNKISVIIPTMWKYPPFLDFLYKLVKIPAIGEIIIINNNVMETPENSVLEHTKVKMHNFNENIFVNPAWNYAASVARCENLCIMNDDVEFDTDVFDFANTFLSENKFLAVVPRDENPSGKISASHYKAGDDLWRFGSIMFLPKENYIPIPDNFKIFMGDMWLFDLMNCIHNQNYIIRNLAYHSPWSSTINTLFKDSGAEVCKQEYSTYTEEINKYLKKYKTNKYIKQIYVDNCKKSSDINEHLPILKKLADECNHVTEMGVRFGESTSAFLNSNVILRSYDLTLDSNLLGIFEMAKSIGKNVEYISADVRNIKIEETDLLFIDTWHIYDQLKVELNMHHSKARKYIVMHDTHTFGVTGEGAPIGLLPALIEFLIEHPEWRFHTHRTNNNGLTVLQRVDSTVSIFQ